MEVRHYVDPSGRDVFAQWLESLRDMRAKIAIPRRVGRLELGHLGDHAWCRDGVWELRVDMGPGYRIYIGRDGPVVVVLLCGGDKSSQQKDIDRAVAAWSDYKQRRQK